MSFHRTLPDFMLSLKNKRMLFVAQNHGYCCYYRDDLSPF